MTFMVGHCRISISFFCPLVLALLFLNTSNDVATAGLTAAAAHEAAHLVTMRVLGCLPEQIRFTAFGIDIVRPPQAGRSYRKDAAISLAGPVLNLVFAAALTLLRSSAVEKLFFANLLLCCFNILPVGPLDGGQALYSLLCIHMEPEDSEKIVSIASFFVLLPLSVIGFFILLRSKGNYSLLLACIYLMTLLVFKKGRYFN